MADDQELSDAFINRVVTISYASIQSATALFVSIVGAIHVQQCIKEEKKHIQSTRAIELNTKYEETDRVVEEAKVEEDIAQNPSADNHEEAMPDVDGKEQEKELATNVARDAHSEEPEAKTQEKADDELELEVELDDDDEEMKKPSNFCKLWLQTIWKMRGVYSGLAVHSFDVLTDILVLVQWLRKANDHGDNINPQAMAYCGIVIIVLSRVLSAVGIYFAERDIRRAIMQLFDLLIFEEIYETHKKIVRQIKNRRSISIKDKDAEIESTLSFKHVRQFEAVFESIPQSVLQLVYIMRLPRSAAADKYNYIFIISILQSIISMANSVPNNDYTRMQDERWKPYKKRFPPTFQFFKHALSRLSEIAYRIGLLALFWTVCGGLPFGIMIAVELVFIAVRTGAFVYWGLQFSGDTVLLNLSQLVIVPSEEVYLKAIAAWHMILGSHSLAVAERDGASTALLHCCFFFVINLCCRCGLAGFLSVFISVIANCSCKRTIYLVPTLRIGMSLMELVFLVFYGVFAENGERQDFLLSSDHGLAVFIATCVFFIIYTQYTLLFPHFSLPGDAGVRSKWGYAYSNELDELKKIKPVIRKKQDTRRCCSFCQPTTKEEIAQFWDEDLEIEDVEVSSARSNETY